MYPFKNLLSVLTLSDRDTSIIKYTAEIARLSNSERIEFVIIDERHHVPDYVRKLYPEKLLNVRNSTVKKIQNDITRVLISDIVASVHFDVIEDHFLDNCLKKIVDKKIDLVLYSKDIHSHDSISFITKLVRRAPCSVLSITQKNIHFHNILVPFDFSLHSGNAIEIAITIANSAGIGNINVLHVFEIPVVSHITEMHYDDFKKAIINNAIKEGDRFIDTFKTNNIKIRKIYEFNERIYSGICKVVKDNKIDLVIMGARGRSSGASIFLGSVTEELVRKAEVPILAVKKKGAGMSILESIFDL
jgi:nucleotide-binding universal stress UspA family protein/ribosomal protein L7Ae-like RNA K-turn-binding protein